MLDSDDEGIRRSGETRRRDARQGVTKGKASYVFEFRPIAKSGPASTDVLEQLKDYIH
jgi:hypothetical protein